MISPAAVDVVPSRHACSSRVALGINTHVCLFGQMPLEHNALLEFKAAKGWLKEGPEQTSVSSRLIKARAEGNLPWPVRRGEYLK